MIKLDIVNEVVNRTGITRTKSEMAVEIVFEAMKKALGSGDRIELRGFGVFNVKPRKTGIGRNPRTGKEVSIAPGKTVRLGRLDLIETPAGKAAVVLEHAWLGPVELPPGRTLTVWDLPQLLPAEATDKAKRAATAALKDDLQAVERLERVLPLCHPAIRAALSESPDAAGAPRLRTILTLFDDSLVQGPVLRRVPR